ncbi:MAG: phosphoenolpyruvate--protein phosphotransferase, partial [Ruminiclostridium sp.]|nr:phosphoenolpyruvate--protein phosphotransferase [Ruminiclostridium sp.]
MIKFKGKGVYGAVAIGKLSVFKRRDVQVKRIKTENAEAEILRFEEAKKKAVAQLGVIYEKALKEVGEANAAIFDIHIMMIKDEDYNEAITEMINMQNVNAEYAVAVTADNFAEMFSSMDDAYMQARSADVRDISNRIINCLSKSESSSEKSDENVIICADDLAPSETVSLDKD